MTSVQAQAQAKYEEVELLSNAVQNDGHAGSGGGGNVGDYNRALLEQRVKEEVEKKERKFAAVKVLLCQWKDAAWCGGGSDARSFRRRL